ncbi:TPA: hypothetical protein ACH3X2_001018 [Trebouxia sp. C0005]
MLNNFHIPSFGQFLNAQSTMPAFRDMTEALGIQCQDIEWFSRAAMLKITLQICTKQGFMPADVLSEATRHAERLVQLAPGNPASHELRSYVHMHDAQQDLCEACRSMSAAMHIAEAAKDDVDVLLYAQQVMYFMLWNFNSTQSKTRDALSLEKSLTGVLRTVKEAEEHIREVRTPESVCDAVQSMASSRLTAAKRRLAALAFTISGTPKALLEYLQPYRPQARNSQSQHTAPVGPSCSQLAHSGGRFVKLGLRLPSMLRRASPAHGQKFHGRSSSNSVPAPATHKTTINSKSTTSKVNVSTAGLSNRSANTQLSCKTAICINRVSSQTPEPAEACTADRGLFPGRAACTNRASTPRKASFTALKNTGGDEACTASVAMVADAAALIALGMESVNLQSPASCVLLMFSLLPLLQRVSSPAVMSQAAKHLVLVMTLTSAGALVAAAALAACSVPHPFVMHLFGSCQNLMSFAVMLTGCLAQLQQQARLTRPSPRVHDIQARHSCK